MKRVGTVDTWLLDRLTGGTVYATEAGNASQTLLFDIEARKAEVGGQRREPTEPDLKVGHPAVHV